MNVSVKWLNRTMLLALTPFLGVLAWLLLSSSAIELSEAAYPSAPAVQAEGRKETAEASAASKLKESLERAEATAKQTGKSIQKQLDLYNRTNADMKTIAQTAAAQANRPLEIYDRRITGKLGTPSATISSDKLRAQLFYITAQNFKGYAMKVKLKSDGAMGMALGNDEFGGAETTLAAVRRTGAVAGVNAGGFADGGGKRYPLSTTIVDGEYVNGFEASYADLFFVGLNEDNELVGGKYTSKDRLDAENVRFGASFVPVLLKNGSPQPIPSKWATSPARAPRTVIANYKDDHLLFLVVDGYNENGSSGATLAEIQLLLRRYGAVDGYNLDGGGSSTLIFNGKVINRPSDGQLRKVATNFLFFK